MSATILYDDAFDSGQGTLTVTLFEFGDADHRVTCIFDGRGSMDGVRALIRMLDCVLEAGPPAGRGDSLLDMRGLDGGTPLRANLSLGRWLLANKGRVGRVAIVGARPFERKLATMVLKLARFTNVRFTEELGGGLDFLGWPTVPQA